MASRDEQMATHRLPAELPGEMGVSEDEEPLVVWKSDDEPPFLGTHLYHWASFLEHHRDYNIPGVVRPNGGGRPSMSSLAGFLRIAEMGPAPFMGEPSRRWVTLAIRAQLENEIPKVC